MKLVEILKIHPLFNNIEIQDIERLLECLDTYERSYKKNEYIILEGSLINFIGIIITGRVFIEKEDYLGNEYIYAEIEKNNIFGEVYIGQSVQGSTVNYKAMTDCVILFIKYKSIFRDCSKNCSYHKKLLENLIKLMASKSRILIEKIEIISKKSLRERIMTYLLMLAEKQKSNRVISHLNHREMSEFLGVNRSAMIRELSRMKREGIIDFNRNQYDILTKSKELFNNN